MSNIQAISLPFAQHASLLSGKAGANQFTRLHQKTRPGVNLHIRDARKLIAEHFLLAIYGETKTRLAAAGAVLIAPEGRSETALLCLTAYSSLLTPSIRALAKERILEGAFGVAEGQGCHTLLETCGEGFKIWHVASRSPAPK